MPALARGERYCGKCQHAVVDVSALTEKSARRLLARAHVGELCVSYLVDSSGQIAFHKQASRIPAGAPALVSLTLALAACGHRTDATRVGGAPMLASGVLVAPSATPATTDSAQPAATDSAQTAADSAQPATTTPPPVKVVHVRRPPIMRLAGKPALSPDMRDKSVACANGKDPL